MSLKIEDYPIPVNPASRRLESIDLLRGLLMIVMAIDHARDFFTSVSGFDPTDAQHSWPSLFATRWITHLCAPGFMALAGASVYLQRERGKTSGQLTKLLVTRGLWLVFLEATVISFGWSFMPALGLQVIWAIGVSMIFLGLLQRLPVAAIGGVGATIVLGHNLLDGITPERWGDGADLWRMVHNQGPLIVHGQMVGFLIYPVVPWIGVICLGYAFGPVAVMAEAIRQRIAAALGAAFLFVFALLRFFHGYGDHSQFQHLASPAGTVMSFLEVEKYPPSLHYLLATLGVLLLLYALLDRVVTADWLPKARAAVEVYGRVPFFYYVLHIYVLHALALTMTAAQHKNWHFWISPGAGVVSHLDGWGYGLGGVYLAWALVVAALYGPCLWFSRVKAKRRDWWLSYL